MIRVALLLALVATSEPAKAEEAGTFTSGNQFMRMCESSSGDKLACLGFTTGVRHSNQISAYPGKAGLYRNGLRCRAHNH